MNLTSFLWLLITRTLLFGVYIRAPDSWKLPQAHERSRTHWQRLQRIQTPRTPLSPREPWSKLLTRGCTLVIQGLLCSVPGVLTRTHILLWCLPRLLGKAADASLTWKSIWREQTLQINGQLCTRNQTVGSLPTSTVALKKTNSRSCCATSADLICAALGDVFQAMEEASSPEQGLAMAPVLLPIELCYP